jgi:hypothetical protein
MRFPAGCGWIGTGAGLEHITYSQLRLDSPRFSRLCLWMFVSLILYSLYSPSFVLFFIYRLVVAAPALKAGRCRPLFIRVVHTFAPGDAW